MEYRAAYVGDYVLTGPEHQNLPDAELIAEAMREAERGGIEIEEWEIKVGMWSDQRLDA